MKRQPILEIVFFIILCLATCLLHSCRKANNSSSSPPSPPVKKWTKYHEGTIANIYFFKEGYISFFWDVQINFEDGKVIRIDRLFCEHSPMIGEYGTLYILSSYLNKSDSYIQNADYRWEKRTIKSVSSLVGTKPSSLSSLKKIPETISSNDIWKDPYRSPPLVHTVVLIRLKDGTTATGYLTHKNDWKADLYKNKMSGEPPFVM